MSFGKQICCVIIASVLALLLCSCGEEKCYDNNKDHLCDVCSSTLSECPVDNIVDHICDICGAVSGECVDLDFNHMCDYCMLAMNSCVDNNYDHKCDFCNVKLTNCADGNKNHLCDSCETPLSECTDTNRDHLDKILSMTSQDYKLFHCENGSFMSISNRQTTSSK